MNIKTLAAAAAFLVASATPGLAADSKCYTHADEAKLLAPTYTLSQPIDAKLITAQAFYLAAQKVLGPAPGNPAIESMAILELIGKPGEDGMIHVVGFLLSDKNDCGLARAVLNHDLMAQLLLLAKKMEPSS